MSASTLKDHYRCPDRYGVDLPFEAGEVIDALRLERYTKSRKSGGPFGQIAKSIYYTLRPWMGVAFRKHLQRAYWRKWKDITFPHWPVDRTVERVFEAVAMLSLDVAREDSMPFVWFWPEGFNGCVILTHDIETEAGRDFSLELADIDASFGFKSSFQVVPEERYEVPEWFLASLRSRQCEINLHGLNHDGRLFESRENFEKQLHKITAYAREFGAEGFRSPSLYRNLDWYKDLEFAYDMSVPNCAHLEPQQGGCCTVLPYFIGGMVELPLTMAQDYSIFHILRQNSIELWKRQMELVLESNGLLSFNIHPDYIREEPYRGIYYELLQHLKTVCEQRNIWIALPNEVNRWWRLRNEMRLGSERAVEARAVVHDGVLVYELEEALHNELLKAG